MTEVRVGQVWADNDKRSEGRHVKVVFLDGTHAWVVRCSPTGRVFTNARGNAAKTRIRLDRFKPTSTGYRLVEDGAR